jgi:uncharacterized SAM-binding protein YcdF (DUF218 family)
MIAAALTLWVVMSLPLVGKSLLGSLERQYRPLDVAAIYDDAAMPAKVTVAVAGNGLSRTLDLNDPFLVRLQEAARIARELQRAGCAFQIVVSVSNPRLSLEEKHQTAARFFENFGIPSEYVTVMEHARNSEEEVTAFLEAPGNVVLVSQAFHLPRLMAIAKRELTAKNGRDSGGERTEAAGNACFSSGGTYVWAAPAGRMAPDDESTILNFIPSADGLKCTETAVYEWLGMAALQGGRQ